jgi:hypothetical protein
MKASPAIQTSTALFREPRNSATTVRVLRSVAEIDEIREAWIAWDGHRDSDLDFYLMILRASAVKVRPHIIVASRDGEPVAILVGRLEESRLAFKLGYLEVFRPRARCINLVYGAIRGEASPENTRILFQELLLSLKRKEADVAILNSVPVNSPLYELGLASPGVFCRDSFPVLRGHDVMEVPDALDDVYKRLSSDRRIETRRRVKKFQGHPAGPPKIVCYQRTSELEQLFHDAEQIAERTYQRGLRVGFEDNASVRERLQFAARAGWLRAYILYAGETPVAFWIGVLYGKTFLSEYMGYDPEFRKWSPGMVLIMQVVQRFCERTEGAEVRELDFGLGTAEYKDVLGNKSWMEGSLYIFSPTFKGIILKGKQTATALADRAARKAAISTNLLPRIKKWWRSRLAEGQKLSSPKDLQKRAGPQ